MASTGITTAVRNRKAKISMRLRRGRPMSSLPTDMVHFQIFEDFGRHPGRYLGITLEGRRPAGVDLDQTGALVRLRQTRRQRTSGGEKGREKQNPPGGLACRRALKFTFA